MQALYTYPAGEGHQFGSVVSPEGHRLQTRYAVDQLNKLVAEVERLQEYVGGNMLLSDFQCVDDMRTEVEQLRAVVEAVKEYAKVKRLHEAVSPEQWAIYEARWQEVLDEVSKLAAEAKES